MPAVVTNLDRKAFQAQYGTLWRATESYLDGQMPVGQAAAFEQVSDFAALVQAVSMTRLLSALVTRIPEANRLLEAI